MIKEYKVGNLLDITEGHIVHGCNTHGVMGFGVALAVKNKYPGAFKVYRQKYDLNQLDLGNVVEYSLDLDNLVIWNAITQQNYGRDNGKYVSYDAVEHAFQMIWNSIEGGWYNVVPCEIHIPKIGAGLGGGNWDILEKIIDVTTKNIPVTVWVLQRSEIPTKRLVDKVA